LIAATSIFFIPIIASNARLALFRYLLSKKDTLNLCFGSQDRHRRGATVVDANGLSIWWRRNFDRASNIGVASLCR
jgi:hypothetical protein